MAGALDAASRRLRAAGVPGARRDAALLLTHAVGDGPAVLLDPCRPLGAATAARFERAVRRRESREPVSRIVGRREFWGMDFALAPPVLDPRPDSETLVRAALAAFAGRAPPRAVLDLGTGSGCLLCALLREFPAAVGVGADLSAEAASVARDNAARLGLGGRAGWLVGNWAAALAGGAFDLVVANPPYVARGALARLPPEVARHEPRGALDGGTDGLDGVRALAPGLVRVARPGAPLFVEVGAGQAARAEALLAAAGCTVRRRHRDLAGIARVIAAQAPAAARLGAVAPVRP